jgi:hypothetical protein
LRAFKKTSLLGYEMPWNNISFTTQCFMPASDEAIAAKVCALSKYESQRNRFYASEEFIRSLAITRGTQVGRRYAECFEVVRWIL